MGRRGTPYGSLRRNLRDGGSQSVTLAPTPPPGPPLPPLPAAGTGDWWHAEIDCDATSWVSQILGNVLDGQNTPTVAVDTGFFNDTLVAQTDDSTDAIWFATALASVGIASGTRPYMCGTWRHRNPATGTQDRMCLSMRGGSSGSEAQLRTGLDSDGAGNDYFMARRQDGFSGATAQSGDIQDTAAHFWEIYTDATLGTVLVMDGVVIASDASATGQAVFAAAVTMVAVGGSFSGAEPSVSIINHASCSMKWFLIWDQAPSAPERAALLAYSQTEYGTP